MHEPDLPKFEKGQPLTAADLQKLARAIRPLLQPGSWFNDQMSLQRKRKSAGGTSTSNSDLQWGVLITEITAMVCPGAWGGGSWQPWDNDGFCVGTGPIEIENRYPTIFTARSVACVDVSFDPPRLVAASCELLDEGCGDCAGTG